MAQRKTIVRRGGKNLAKVLSQTLAKDYYTAVLEFVSNAYDADSEHVKINVNTLEDCLSIEDDGLGMDESGIDNFFRLGDSEKLSNPISPKGRRKIGKFGIAKVLLEYLAGTYTIESFTGKKKVTVTEDFSKKDHRPQVTVESLAKQERGTKITMNHLRFDSKSLAVKRLKQVLEWQVPCLPDFSINLNGIMVPKRSVVTYCTEYSVDQQIRGLGDLTGSIFYKGSGSVDTPGIYIYVNGRAVGNPNSFNEHMKGAMLTKVVGIVNADFLEKYIVFDRSRFQEDSVAYQKVHEAIRKVISSLRSDIEKGNAGGRAYFRKDREYERISLALKEAEARLNKGIIQDQTMVPKKLELIPDERAQWQSRYDQEREVITINAASPLFSILGMHTNVRETLEQFFLMLAISAIVDNRISADPKSKKVIDMLYSTTNAAAKGLFSGKPIKNVVRSVLESENSVIPLEHMNLNPYRLYAIDDISYITGLDMPTVKYLYMSGALKPHSKSGLTWKFKSDDIMSCLKSIEGCVPVAKALEQSDYFRRMHISLSEMPKIEQKLMERNDRPDYVKNVGTKEKPFLWIPKERTAELREYFSRSKK